MFVQGIETLPLRMARHCDPRLLQVERGTTS
jgi:O-acetylhomoserine/O-acetylserine sulfhydrylase-like pyridoxal-dependent enzyme